MKFSELKYSRPDINALKEQFASLLQTFNTATASDKQIQIVNDINKTRSEFETLASIANVKYTQDTTSAFNQQEQDFFDKNSPVFYGLVVDFYKAILLANNKEVLENYFGKQLFSIARMTVDTFKEEVLADLQKENQLVSEYTKLVSSAKISFKEKIYNLSEIALFAGSSNREERKLAHEARYKFFSDNQTEFNRLYDE